MFKTDVTPNWQGVHVSEKPMPDWLNPERHWQVPEPVTLALFVGQVVHSDGQGQESAMLNEFAGHFVHTPDEYMNPSPQGLGPGRFDGAGLG